jgi:hypothetical protein
MQPKRGMKIGNDGPIMSRKDWKAGPVTLDGSPLRVDTAHFGLTLIRVEALERVANIELPDDAQISACADILGFSREQVRGIIRARFLHIPDESGGFGSNRIDPDCHFWRRWEKAGNTCYIDTDVRIGHLQAMVAEFAPNDEGILATRYVHWPQWRAENCSTGRMNECLEAVNE